MPELQTRKNTTVTATAVDVDRKIFALRLAGHSYLEIVEKLGLSGATRVRAGMTRQMALRRDELATMAEHATVIEHDRLESMTRAVWPRVVGGEILHPDTGAPIPDENGNPLHYAPDLKAIATALAIHDRKARLLGLDKTRIEITGSVEVTTSSIDTSRLSAQEIAIVEHLQRKAAGLLEASGDADTLEGELADASEGAEDEA